VEDLDLRSHDPPTRTLALGGLGCHLWSPRRHLSAGVVILEAFMRLLARVGKFMAFGGPTFHLLCPTSHT
jgi:hypothetical protein